MRELVYTNTVGALRDVQQRLDGNIYRWARFWPWGTLLGERLLRICIADSAQR
jgi:hypothetical protein